jgi:LmbE family N-acetylglucosaminyl deacetylase
MNLIGKKILCFAPHPDDIEFGMGATLNKYSDTISFRGVVFSDRFKTRGEINNRKDQISAANTLGFTSDNIVFLDEIADYDLLPIRFFDEKKNRDLIRHYITEEVNNFKPDVIFSPSLSDTHQDHQAIAEEVTRVLRGPYSIFGYEVPKHNRFFKPNCFISIDEKNLLSKIKAINCFSEFSNRYYFGPDQIRALSVVRALDAGFDGYVEAFEVNRLYI